MYYLAFALALTLQRSYAYQMNHIGFWMTLIIYIKYLKCFATMPLQRRTHTSTALFSILFCIYLQLFFLLLFPCLFLAEQFELRVQYISIRSSSRSVVSSHHASELSIYSFFSRLNDNIATVNQTPLTVNSFRHCIFVFRVFQ